MRIAIFGTGALGGYFGARLARAGLATTFIARGAMLQALRGAGLRIESATLGTFTVAPVAATDDPAQAGPADVVLLTTKAYDLEDTARALRPLLGPGTLVLPLLNGVEVAERLGAILGMEHMLGGLTYVGAGVVAPGVVRHLANEGITLGEPAGGISRRAEAVRDVLAQAGIASTVSVDFAADSWTKLVLFAGSGGVLAAARVPYGAIRANPEIRALFIAVCREVEAVARAQGVALAPDVVARTLATADAFPPETQSSMLRDILAGRPLELDAVHGQLLRLAKPLGVPTPACAFIHAVLGPHARGKAG